MARLLFTSPAGEPASWYRFDTASGSNTPATIANPANGRDLDYPELQANPNSGSLPAVLGQDGTTTMYRKKLTGQHGTVVGSATTITGAAPAAEAETSPQRQFASLTVDGGSP